MPAKKQVGPTKDNALKSERAAVEKQFKTSSSTGNRMNQLRAVVAKETAAKNTKDRFAKDSTTARKLLDPITPKRKK